MLKFFQCEDSNDDVKLDRVALLVSELPLPNSTLLYPRQNHNFLLNLNQSCKKKVPTLQLLDWIGNEANSENIELTMYNFAKVLVFL